MKISKDLIAEIIMGLFMSLWCVLMVLQIILLYRIIRG